MEAAIYNPLGQKVLDVTMETYSRGSHLITFPAKQHAPGLYFISISTGRQVTAFKMIRQ